MKAMARPRSVRAFFVLVGLAAVALPALAAPTASGPAAIGMAPTPAMIQQAAIGDPPRRRARRASGKDKPYVPLAKDPQGESAAGRKEYLKRYGF